MNDGRISGLHAFAGFGIELEYMIVDCDRLSVLPIADRLLRAAAGDGDPCEVDRGILGWSNEFVMHVIEMKNPRPIASLSMLPKAFQAEVGTMNEMLEPMGARLMPTAMHPWMDPRAETRLWPHQNDAIYKAYERIFDVRTHGWANLQSMHVNLPFGNDEEFARLHAAVRLALPVLPALAASSPVADGRNTGCMDYRMQVYAGNSDKIPSLAGRIVPPNASSRAEYEETILGTMYRDIAPFDAGQVLRHEWLNSHGAIARFDRQAIEIRVIDMQECPHADLAVAAAASSLTRSLYRSGKSELALQQAISTDALAAILHSCIADAEQAVIDDAEYLALLGFPDPRCSARELWCHLVDDMMRTEAEHVSLWNPPLQTILRHGPLARRIMRAAGPDCRPGRLEAVYRALCDCLRDGRMFEGLD
jgi:hypothetical protein